MAGIHEGGKPTPEASAKREGARLVVRRQLDHYLNRRNHIQEVHGMNRTEREVRFLRGTLHEIIEERSDRAEDQASSEVQEAIDIANSLFPLAPFGVDCIDSRVMRTIKYGLPLGVGGFTRVLGGDLTEFVQGQGRGLILLPDSYYEALLSEAFDGRDAISQVLDSHVGCKARGDEELSKGRNPQDKGLFQDVLRKKFIAEAMVQYAKDRYKGKKAIYPIQTSFDPYTGYMYMGLEKDEVLSEVVEKTQRDQFTDSVLRYLVHGKKIIHTGTLVSERRIENLFSRYRIQHLDWEKDYRLGMVKFWNNMRAMANEGLLDAIGEYVREVFPDIAEIELRERSILLAANAYNAYHLNVGGIYPFAEHKESCVVVSEGENGPYGGHPSFSVFSKAREALGENILLADGIIRQNRREGRIHDTTGQYDQIQDYVEAPISVVVKMILRDNHIDWDAVRKIDWSDMPDNWAEMDNDAFQQYLVKRSPNMSLNVVMAINMLREKMVIIYDPKRTVQRFIFGGQLEVVPMLVDAERMPQSIIPFVHKGYRK